MSRPKSETAVAEPVAVRIGEAARLLSCGRSTVYNLLRSGQLRAIQVGADRRILVDSIRELAK